MAPAWPEQHWGDGLSTYWAACESAWDKDKESEVLHTCLLSGLHVQI